MDKTERYVKAINAYLAESMRLDLIARLAWIKRMKGE